MRQNRKELAQLIYSNLYTKKEILKEQFLSSKNKIGFFVVDDLLEKDLVEEIYAKFPKKEDAIKRKNLREYKYTAYQMDRYNPLLEEVIYAFQDQKVIEIVSEICELEEVYEDESLYAGGLSLMGENNFLNPHLDNSHDKNRNRWRVLNLLYYVTPNWQLENGGSLELWQNGLNEKPTIVESKFNRLVVMATHQNSWHSVSKVTVNEVRCCVSNYYFSKTPLLEADAFHVTTFRGQPTKKTIDYLLQVDNGVRTFLRKIFRKGVRENPHQYKK
jgi:Rps23 Pro-64 3,4-dihydroxylase Tpa1-like proline 4-hydroxylase